MVVILTSHVVWRPRSTILKPTGELEIHPTTSTMATGQTSASGWRSRLTGMSGPWDFKL